MKINAQPVAQTFSYISGVGMNVPSRIVPNSHFASYLETSDEWIQDRTGIRERRWVDAGTGASELAEVAALQAISSAGLTVADIDGIVLATVTPDFVFPSAACILQARLGITRGFAFDVNAVCTGFVYALTVADSLIVAGRAKHLLVVGVDIFSHIINPQDRTTCVLFGDGAGAVVLSSTDSLIGGHRAVDAAPRLRTPMTGSLSEVRGIVAAELHSDGSQAEILCVPNGTASPLSSERMLNGDHLLKMSGREVFKQAVRALTEVSKSVMTKTGIEISELDYFISHQANRRILVSVAKQLGIPEAKVLMNVDKYGNTSAASLPILLAESVQSGALKPGDLVMLSAFGGGVTWGAMLLRW